MSLKLPRGDRRLVFEPVRHADYVIKPARYAAGKVLVSAPGLNGWHTRCSRLACALGRWVNRETGYIMSPAAAERFASLYAEGADASAITGEIHQPGSEENP